MINGKARTEREYRDLELDSSSSLKEFSFDRRKYHKKYILGEKTEEEELNNSSTIGLLVETLLFEKEKFDIKFFTSSILNPPTGLMGDFVEALWKYTNDSTNQEGDITRDFKEIALDAYKKSGFKLKFETVLEKFNGSDAELWYKEVREIRGKNLIPVTIDQIENAEKIVNELKSNDVTAPVLNLVNSDRYTILIQHQIEGYLIDGLPMKSMLDLIVIDHKEKTISPFDLKVVWSVEGFYDEYYLYRRAYIQAYVYKEACLELRSREGLEYYNVLNPQFIVSDSINYFNPLIYTLDSDDMDDAYNGFEYKGRKYPGTRDIIADLKWAKEEDKWNISRKSFLNGGVVNIKG